MKVKVRHSTFMACIVDRSRKLDNTNTENIDREEYMDVSQLIRLLQCFISLMLQLYSNLLHCISVEMIAVVS